MTAPSGKTPVLGFRYPVPNDDVNVPRDIQALAEDVEGFVQAFIGEMRMFGFSAIPQRWLPCDGTTREQSAYPELFGKISTTWNTGGETGTQFRLPDVGGRALVGVGRAAGGGIDASPPLRTIATKWGVNAVILTIAQMPAHNHGTNDPGHRHAMILRGNQGPGPTWLNAGTQLTQVVGTVPDFDNPLTPTGITIQNNGGGGSHENNAPSVAIPVFIYAGRV